MEYLYTNHLQSILSCVEKSAYGIAVSYTHLTLPTNSRV